MPLRSGRGITTSESVNRGPRCGKCAEWVQLVARDVNGTMVCPRCGPAKLFDDVIRVVDGPEGLDDDPIEG